MTHTITNIDATILNEMSCMFFPCRGWNCNPQYRPLYEDVYALWKKTMGDALRYESKISEPELLSDEFFRQHEVVAIYYKAQPVGLFIFDWLNLQFKSTREHSYFSNFPNSVLDTLVSRNIKTLMSASHLCVHPDWRRRKIGPGISEICYGIAAKRMFDSNAEALITYTRNDRSIHQIVYDFGGEAIQRNILSHGIPADIIIIHRSKIKPCSKPQIQAAVDRLYQSYLDVRMEQNQYFSMAE